jgi:hypothetical protein
MTNPKDISVPLQKVPNMITADINSNIFVKIVVLSFAEDTGIFNEEGVSPTH